MRLITLCLLTSLALSSYSQDSVATKKIIPGFYFDYGKGLVSLATDDLKLEGSAEIILNNGWQVVGEMGYWNMKPEWAIENGEYHVRGNYIRFGFGYLPQLTKDSRFGIGVRYASSKFRDKGNYTLENDIQEPINVPFKRISEEANWYELVMYSDKNVNNWLALGFNLRMRFGLDYQEYEPVDIVTIPGYGRPQDKISPAVNLFMKISF